MLQADYTQREGNAIEASRVSVQYEVPVTGGGVSRWRGGCGSQASQLQWQDVSSRGEVQEGFKHDLWYSQAQALDGQSSEL